MKLCILFLLVKIFSHFRRLGNEQNKNIFVNTLLAIMEKNYMVPFLSCRRRLYEIPSCLPGLSLNTKLIDALGWSVALYGYENWTFRKEEMDQIDALEMQKGETNMRVRPKLGVSRRGLVEAIMTVSTVGEIEGNRK